MNFCKNISLMSSTKQSTKYSLDCNDDFAEVCLKHQCIIREPLKVFKHISCFYSYKTLILMAGFCYPCKCFYQTDWKLLTLYIICSTLTNKEISVQWHLWYLCVVGGVRQQGWGKHWGGQGGSEAPQTAI